MPPAGGSVGVVGGAAGAAGAAGAPGVGIAFMVADCVPLVLYDRAGDRGPVLRGYDTARAWGDDPALHQLFERQADLRPEAPAGICQGETVTYGELEARANRLAHRLRALGVRRAEPVGLWMERSLDLLAAVLGAPVLLRWLQRSLGTLVIGFAARLAATDR